MKTYVAYFRVSTAKQGESGLGLEAQRAAVASFAQGSQVIAEFEEVESGKKDDRPQLLAAIAACRKHKATLLLAKMDRMSRETSYIMDFPVPFVSVEMPELTTLTKGIYATIAQHERETIAKRTKDALAAKKARGEELGNLDNLTNEGRAKGREIQQANARAHKANVQASDVIQHHHATGKSLREIAAILNEKHFTTRRGCQFTAAAVQRLLLKK